MQIDISKKEEISMAEINLLATNVRELLASGSYPAFLLLQKATALKKFIEEINEDVRAACVAEAGKYSDKEKISLYGAEFKKIEAGTKYIYEDSKDPVWMRMKAEFDSAKSALDKRQDFLKTIVGHETTVDEATGEIVTIYPPTKTSTTSVSCTIK